MALEGFMAAGWQMEVWFGVFWPPPLPVLCSSIFPVKTSLAGLRVVPPR